VVRGWVCRGGPDQAQRLCSVYPSCIDFTEQCMQTAGHPFSTHFLPSPSSLQSLCSRAWGVRARSRSLGVVRLPIVTRQYKCRGACVHGSRYFVCGIVCGIRVWMGCIGVCSSYTCAVVNWRGWGSGRVCTLGSGLGGCDGVDVGAQGRRMDRWRRCARENVRTAVCPEGGYFWRRWSVQKNLAFHMFQRSGDLFLHVLAPGSFDRKYVFCTNLCQNHLNM